MDSSSSGSTRRLAFGATIENLVNRVRQFKEKTEDVNRKKQAVGVINNAEERERDIIQQKRYDTARQSIDSKGKKETLLQLCHRRCTNFGDPAVDSFFYFLPTFYKPINRMRGKKQEKNNAEGKPYIWGVLSKVDGT